MNITISLADERDRESIYAIRHEIYACELRQHPDHATGRLTDRLDTVNTYLIAKDRDETLGFVSITPPNSTGYSLDKYFPREALPITFDDALYEVRLLTVRRAHRGTPLAFLLMYGALRYLEVFGARTVAAIGRLEVLKMYQQVGFRSVGLQARSGMVTYELMTAQVRELRDRVARFERIVSRLEGSIDWQLGVAPFRTRTCFHGGAFFEAIGEEFETLGKKDSVINADVLDAWFDPAPAVVHKLAEYLPFAIKTSPPTSASGMRRAIARARGVDEACILPGAGSSDLIYAGLRQWIAPAASAGVSLLRASPSAAGRVLILDPMYGEYAHVLEQVIGAPVDRLTLRRERNYDVDLDELGAQVARGYVWVVLVNPNSPTGRRIAREDLLQAIAKAPKTTRWWIDETYIEYAGAGESVEACAASSTNVVVCKSMSKAYALSGVRAAYLCGPPSMIGALEPFCPPWSVSLPAQIAACEALNAIDYYRARWAETHGLRSALAEGLTGLGFDVVPSSANFLLCRLPSKLPDAPVLVKQLRERGMFIRDVASMGLSLDARAVRIAVKDRDTNLAMLEILRARLSENIQLKFSLSSSHLHDF